MIKTTEGKINLQKLNHLTPDEFDSEMKSWSFAQFFDFKRRVAKALNKDYANGYLDAISDFAEKLEVVKKEFPHRSDFPYETNIESVEDRFYVWFEKLFGIVDENKR